MLSEYPLVIAENRLFFINVPTNTHLLLCRRNEMQAQMQQTLSFN